MISRTMKLLTNPQRRTHTRFRYQWIPHQRIQFERYRWTFSFHKLPVVVFEEVVWPVDKCRQKA
jgi:hypothetical protein